MGRFFPLFLGESRNRERAPTAVAAGPIARNGPPEAKMISTYSDLQLPNPVVLVFQSPENWTINKSEEVISMEEKKGLIAEFKEFIMRGNVLDMAIGVIIATAFGAITTSLINNIIMPLIGLIFGGIDLSKWDILLSPEVVDEAGEVVKEASYLGIGTFITAVINFILIALVVFAIVKAMNKVNEMKKKKEEEEEEAPAEPSAEEVLLTEIRDLLKDRK